jgi:UDP-N-acetylglucosamine transferase subunit ALG13
MANQGQQKKQKSSRVHSFVKLTISHAGGGSIFGKK